MPAAPIVLVSYSGVLGGAERILLDSAVRLGRPAVVACPDGALAEAARAAGLEVNVVRERTLLLRGGPADAARHAAGVIALARDTARVGRGRRGAALVAWGARAVLACALVPRRRRPPLVAVHCDLAPRGATGRAVRVATRRADRVVALSHAIADSVAPGAAVLHPGVDLAAWAPAPAPPPDPPRALVLGALVPWKRVDLALEIAARLPELRLEIGGEPIPGDDGAFTDALRRRAQQPDLRERVAFLGAIDPRPALARAHALLHCADAEPYGLALVEALAVGRPVVAPDAAGPREIVAASAGRLYVPGDPDAGAAALRAVLSDRDAPAAARSLAEERFDVERSAARLRAAVEELA